MPNPLDLDKLEVITRTWRFDSGDPAIEPWSCGEHQLTPDACTALNAVPGLIKECKRLREELATAKAEGAAEELETSSPRSIAPKLKLRPMSEAPRDGERILLYFELDDARTGYYCKRSFPADDPWVVGRDTCGDHDFIGYLPLPEVDL